MNTNKNIVKYPVMNDKIFYNEILKPYLIDCGVLKADDKNNVIEERRRKMEIIKGEDLKGMQFVKDEEGRLVVYEPKGRYVPKIGEGVWWVGDFGSINSITMVNKPHIRWLINHEIVFRTEEECKDYKWFLEQLDKYKHDFSKDEWEDEDVKKWNLVFDHLTNNLEINSCYFYQTCFTCYFTETSIKQFRDTVGDERIKKYMFDIWE